MNQELPLSISIISFNEEDNIGRTLESIRDISKEIVIVDCHSTDKTVEICKKYGASVYIEDWKGHIAQKNSALAKCKQEWILMLDCDEVVSKELKNEIINAINKNEYSGYQINRRTFYLGRLLKYSWQPDWNLRLTRKSANPRWVGYDPHDKLIIDSKYSKLKGDLVHYSYSGIHQHFQKTINYAKISAESYIKNGKKFRLINLFVNPVIAFIRLYFLHRGFLDGFRGFIASFSSFIYTFLKYLFLWELEKK